MVANAQPQHLEVQVCECVSNGNRFMAWVSGYHHSYEIGRTPQEAIGALVERYPEMFGVSRVNFR